MVISMRKLASFLVISLAAAVISLETDARAAIMPDPLPLRPTWDAGFGALVGKMAKDAAGNLYVVDIENRRILKFGPKLDLDPTATVSTPAIISVAAYGTPYGIAVLSGGKMVVTFLAPVPRVLLLDSTSGQQLASQGDLATAGRFQSPVAVAVDSQENIYVLDAGIMKAPLVRDAYGDPANPHRFVLGSSRPCVQVFTSAGVKYASNIQTTQNRNAGYPDNSFSSASMLYNAENYLDREPGLLMLPEGMVYDAVGKRIIVADSMGGRVQFFAAADNAGTKFAYLDQLGSMTPPSSTLHMTMPVGLAMDTDPQGASRLYVVDKVLHRILVIDPVAKVELGVINTSRVPGLDLVFPRDILVYKGNLLVANEQGAAKANLRTIGLGAGANWPPVNLHLTFNELAARQTDANFPNIKSRAGNTFPITGEVDAGAIVTYTVNGGAPVDCTETGTTYSCNVVFSTAQTDQTVRVQAVKGADNAEIELPHINYYTTANLPYLTGPALTFDLIPAAEQFRKTNSIAISGKVNYSAVPTSPLGKELTVEIAVVVGGSEQPQRIKAVVDVAGAGNDKVWTATVPLLTDAVNTLTPYAYVEGSVKATAAGQQVTVDTILPDVKLGFLDSNSITTDQVQNVTGIVVDRNLDKIYLDINDVATELSSEILDAAAGKRYFSALALLSQNGVNTVRVRAKDKAGNEFATAYQRVELKPMLLAVTDRLKATSQPDSFFYPHSGVQLAYGGKVPAGTTGLTFGTEGSVGGVTGTDWTHTTSTILSNKSQTIVPITITATGASYGSVSKFRSLYLDPAIPGVKITSPVEDTALNTDNITFSYTVEPRVTTPVPAISQVTAILYDSANTVVYSETKNRDGSYTTASISMLNRPSGVYTLKVTATDGTNTTVATRNIIYDKVKTSVGIALNYDPGVIRGYIEPGATVAVTYNGVAVPQSNVSIDPVNPSYWSVTGSFPDYSLISVRGTDVAGNINDRVWQTTQPNADVDGDGALRVYDALVALRGLVAGNPDSQTLKQGDIAPLVNGIPAPDGLLTLEDAVAVLRKVEGKTW